MTSQPGYKTIAVHIFPSILRSKGHQTMKFDQLIEYHMKNIFLVAKLLTDLFLQNQN